MSDVEKYWDAIRKHTGDTRSWNELHPNLQVMVIQSINMLLQVINTKG